LSRENIVNDRTTRKLDVMQLFGAWRFAPMLIFVAVAAIGLGHASELRAHAIEDATDFLLDAKMQIQQMDDLKKEVDELAPKVDDGEDDARKALTRLIALSNEPNAKWIMEKSEKTGAGRLREEGEIKLDEEISAQAGPSEIYDESGNKIEVKKKVETKEAKKMIKDIEKKMKENAKKKTLSEEEMWELGDKLAELKEIVAASKE